MSNIRRNRNVTILIDVEEPTLKGVLIYGKAQLEKMDTRDRYISEAMRVFERYMSRDEAERYAVGLFKIAKKGVKITIRPERIVSFDTSKDETLRNAVRGQQETGWVFWREAMIERFLILKPNHEFVETHFVDWSELGVLVYDDLLVRNRKSSMCYRISERVVDIGF